MQPEQWAEADLNTFAACPSSYSPSLFFSRYLRAFLPPYFADTAERIGGECGVDFVKLWGWESARLMAREGISEAVGDVQYYASRTDGSALNGATSRIADVYRSAFLRTLAWLKLTGLIGQNDYVEYSLKILPIDPSIWEIESQPIPEWWPKVCGSSGDIETLPEWDQCVALLERKLESGELIAAEGTVVSLPERPLTATEFKLLPLAYLVKGPEFPEVAKVFSALARCVWLKYPQSARPLVIFDGTDMHDWVPLHDPKESMADLTVSPLVARIRSLNINHWQPWRGYHPPLFPSVNLAKPSGKPCQDGISWSYEIEGKRVFWGHDWKIGSLERSSKGQYMSHGQYAIVDRNWLDSWLHEEALRLGHVLRISLQHRKNDYDEPKEFHSYRFIRVSSLIL